MLPLALRWQLKDNVTNPGEYKELDFVKRIEVEESEGLAVMYTNVLGGDSGSSFALQHTFVPPPARGALCFLSFRRSLYTTPGCSACTCVPVVAVGRKLLGVVTVWPCAWPCVPDRVQIGGAQDAYQLSVISDSKAQVGSFLVSLRLLLAVP